MTTIGQISYIIESELTHNIGTSMPKAHYRFADGKDIVDIKRHFPMPSRLERQESWITAMRKTIPEIPDIRRTDWQIGSFQPETKFIMIELFNSVGQHARIAVDRRSHQLG